MKLTSYLTDPTKVRDLQENDNENFTIVRWFARQLKPVAQPGFIPDDADFLESIGRPSLAGANWLAHVPARAP